jgi:hypothetical protein
MLIVHQLALRLPRRRHFRDIAKNQLDFIPPSGNNFVSLMSGVRQNFLRTECTRDYMNGVFTDNFFMV